VTGESSTATGLARVEVALVRLLELVSAPEAGGPQLREAWRACAETFAQLPPADDLARLARGEPALAQRLRAGVRLNGLVLAGAQRQGTLTADALAALRGQREGLALLRRDDAGSSCDVTG
jgi:hypothetical protein